MVRNWQADSAGRSSVFRTVPDAPCGAYWTCDTGYLKRHQYARGFGCRGYHYDGVRSCIPNMRRHQSCPHAGKLDGYRRGRERRNLGRLRGRIVGLVDRNQCFILEQRRNRSAVGNVQHGLCKHWCGWNETDPLGCFDFIRCLN